VRARAASVIAAAILASPAIARADAASLFGAGAPSAGRARADVAAGEASDAPRANAALAADPGVRLRLSYGYGALGLRFNGADAGVAHVSGVDLGVQGGGRVGAIRVGAAMNLHLPDAYLAAIEFRPPTEPQFLLYEAPLQRTTVDVVGAVGWGPVAIGGGVASTLSVGGKGTNFVLGQDARGTFADAGLDVALPYRFAPIAGIRADFGRAAIGASFRGAAAIDLRLDNAVRVDLQNSPLNGTTSVKVSGPAGWDPATLNVGVRVALLGGLSVMGSLEYAVYSAAPAPVADVVIDVHLGTTPGQREARFNEPRFHDTVSPRLALELRRPGSSGEWRWAARAGYALAPTPVPVQTGFTTYLDANRHTIALGGGYHLGKALGVDFALDVAGQLHVLAHRVEDKTTASLPYAHFEIGGTVLYGAATLEAAWK
jgi:hypothetical protein